MTVTADLAAIDADDTKTPAEKRRAKRQVRARAFGVNVQPLLNRNIRLPSGRRLKIDALALFADDQAVEITYTRQGQPQNTVRIVNLPFKIPDGGVDATGFPTYTEDLAAAGLQILERLP